MLSLELLHGRAGALTSFLPVERERDGNGFSASLADEIERFTDGGASGDHIVDDHHASAKCRAHDVAAFAVILGFLAVERVRNVAAVMLGERDRGGGHQ